MAQKGVTDGSWTSGAEHDQGRGHGRLPRPHGTADSPRPHDGLAGVAWKGRGQKCPQGRRRESTSHLLGSCGLGWYVDRPQAAALSLDEGRGRGEGLLVTCQEQKDSKPNHVPAPDRTRGPGCGARHVELYSLRPGDPQGLCCPPHSSGQGVAGVVTTRAALYQRLSKRPAESQPPTAWSARAPGGFRGQQRPRPSRDTCSLGGSS